MCVEDTIWSIFLCQKRSSTVNCFVWLHSFVSFFRFFAVFVVSNQNLHKFTRLNTWWIRSCRKSIKMWSSKTFACNEKGTICLRHLEREHHNLDYFPSALVWLDFTLDCAEWSQGHCMMVARFSLMSLFKSLSHRCPLMKFSGKWAECIGRLCLNSTHLLCVRI